MAEEEKKTPTHMAYAVRDFQKDGQEDASWSKIGVAWVHRDGKGFEVVLDVLPVNGREVLRLNVPKQRTAE
jgi:hypothetical protein